MEYCLPHAVMAFLQEEHSLRLPKTYFISSSTKSTKITLVYTRQKPDSYKSDKKSRSTNELMKHKVGRARSQYSTSSTDDYTQRPQSVQRRKFSDCDQSKLTRRICSSTPGRGYSGEARTREMRRSTGTAKMPTDPVIGNSPSKDHVSISQLTSNIGGHPDSDWDDTFGVLSPRSLISDRPPTPGREISSSNSPRPPTPNASNYASLMSNAKYGLHHTNKPNNKPQQQTAEYDNVNAPRPLTPSTRRQNDMNISQSKRKSPAEVTNHKDAARKAKQQLATANTQHTLPPITVHTEAPPKPSKHHLSRHHSHRH